MQGEVNNIVGEVMMCLLFEGRGRDIGLGELKCFH